MVQPRARFGIEGDLETSPRAAAAEIGLQQGGRRRGDGQIAGRLEGDADTARGRRQQGVDQHQHPQTHQPGGRGQPQARLHQAEQQRDGRSRQGRQDAEPGRIDHRGAGT
jgi:hypothetical protein